MSEGNSARESEFRNQSPKPPSWVNLLLLGATFACLALVLLFLYRGWKTEQAHRLLAFGTGSHFIADITVNLAGIPYQEHCLTCHPQGKGVRFSGRGLVFQDHPAIGSHSMDALGCTSCHLGEGMARDLVLSHGVPGGEARKVLVGEELQSSCYRCHELKALPGAEKAWQGFLLFGQNACDTCHNVDGSGGGRYGPDLSVVGSLLGVKQIQTAIEEPKADLENSIMPKFSLSPEEIRALSYFLKSRTRERFNETPMSRMAKLRQEERARAREEKEVASLGEGIMRQKKCLACHKFQKKDGHVGPDLTYLAYMREEDYIRNFLYNPRKEIPGAIMPWISLSGEEEKRVVQSLQKRDKKNNPEGKGPKHLYMMLCQRCHAAQGDGFGNIQPNLATFPRAFWKNGEFFRRIPDERIVNSVEKGIPGTSMPSYGGLLKGETVDSLIDLIFREFIRIKRRDKGGDLRVPLRPPVLPAKEKREKEFRKFCSSCHGIAGTGKGPDYLKYLPRPRDLTNQPYFKSLRDDRIAMAIAYGEPGTAMPSFIEKISPESLWSLVEKIREVSNTHGR